MNENFLNRLKHINNYDNYILDISNYLSSLEYQDINGFNNMSEYKLYDLARTILKRINTNYFNLFYNALIEQNCNNPVILVFYSKEDIYNNESNTFNHEVYFYKTNTMADIYLLLHEFSHLLVNRKGSYRFDYNKKRYDEVIPILMEYIISNIINNNEYNKYRLNKTISYAKSILVKEEINNGNYDLDSLFNKYRFDKSDIEFFKNDLLFTKSLEYEEEKRYIYGLVYANYYSLEYPIYYYNKLVEEYTSSRNILLPRIKPKEVILSLSKK